MKFERERYLEKVVRAEHNTSAATALPSHRTIGLNVRVTDSIVQSPDQCSSNQTAVRGRVKGSFIDRVAVAVPTTLSAHQHDTHKGPRRYAAPGCSIVSVVSSKKMKTLAKNGMPGASKSIDEYFKRKNCSE